MSTKDDDKRAVPKGAASDKTLRNKLAEAGLTHTADDQDNAVVSYDGKLWTVRATESGFSVSTPGKITLTRGIVGATDVVTVIKGGRPGRR
jgi:hypothetical protein